MEELPFRALIKHLDGDTSDPNALKAQIGRQVIGTNEHSVCNFEKVFLDHLPRLANEIIKKNSTDQKYLYEKHNAIQSGKCPPFLKKEILVLWIILGF